MKSKGSSLRSYYYTSRSLLYSYLVSLPLLLLYEALLYISQPDATQTVRISVDVWIKTLFTYLGQDILSITLIILAFIGVYILYRERHQLRTLKIRYFIFMIFEAAFYAFLLAMVISISVSEILNLLTETPLKNLSQTQKLALSLGAGIYEELFFRVILVSTLLYIFQTLFKRNRTAYITAIILAATIFSLVHYLGDLGDAFSWSSFLFRFLFGLALNTIYIWRGFGLAAWTHAIYDIKVILL